MTVLRLRSLMKIVKSGWRQTTGSGWLLCVPMTEEEAALFAPGDTVTAELRGQSLRVKTKSVLPGPGAERWVLFSFREGLEAVSSVRTVQVSLVLHRAEGYLLPAAALRREDGETVVDWFVIGGG